jgi:hypothetical protein
MKNIDVLEAVAALNPYPELSALESPPARDRTFARVLARRGPAARTLPGRAAVAAIVLATALALPALAISGRLGEIFGFSNAGTGVDRVDLRSASALDLAGSGKLSLLASRNGIGVYAATGTGGERCFFVGPPRISDRRGIGGGCLNAKASANFPSREEPVVDMSAFAYAPYTRNEQVRRLAGVAADGVATVEVIGANCTVIARTPVRDNVYATTDVPAKPAAGIRALDRNGKTVFLLKLRFWAC